MGFMYVTQGWSVGFEAQPVRSRAGWIFRNDNGHSMVAAGLLGRCSDSSGCVARVAPVRRPACAVIGSIITSDSRLMDHVVCLPEWQALCRRFCGASCAPQVPGGLLCCQMVDHHGRAVWELRHQFELAPHALYVTP